MAKKGRPFTYQSDGDRPVTISVRLPAELADLVKRYAAAHGQMPISELIREGLEWRIGDGDPRGTGLYLDEPVGIREQVYHSNTGKSTAAPQADEVLQEVHALLALQWEQIQALAQALEHRRVLPGDSVYSSNTEIAPSTPPVAMTPKMKVDKEEVLVRIQQMREGGLDSTQITKSLQAEGVPTLSGDAQLQAVVDMLEPIASMEAQSTLIQPLAGEDTRESMPPYDPTKYRLGKLCPSKHEWGSTGKSRLKTSGSCPMCEADRKRDKRAREKAEREAQPVAG